MSEDETSHSLRLCALASLRSSDLTQGRKVAATQRQASDARDLYTRDGYCYRPQKTSELEQCMAISLSHATYE